MNSVASVLRRRAPWMFALSLGLSLVCGVGALLDVAPLQYLNRLSYDQLSRLFTPDRDATRVQVVSIDEASLAALGQWPWPRYRVAELLSRVAEAQPAAIAVDILFSEPDRTSLKALQQTFQDDFGVQLSFSGVPVDLQDNDGYLGHVMDQVGAVGARFFALDKASHSPAVCVPVSASRGRSIPSACPRPVACWTASPPSPARRDSAASSTASATATASCAGYPCS